jgi:outer membrane protein TolC
MLMPGYLLQSQDMLQAYIREGLENNLALKQKETSLKMSLEALREAKGLFYPNVSLNARYTISEGGRVINFPVGDLMNPVYATLNDLTSSNAFPMVENQQIRFLRPAEHETKLRLVQPVFNTDVYYNAKIREEYTLAEEISVDQYRRELIAEIKKAYYQAGMTSSVVSMLVETRKLLEENVRVNERLVENDKITIDNLFRSRTELSKMDQQIQVAVKNRQLSQAYFNFLLNRSLMDSVTIEIPEEPLIMSNGQANFTQQALDYREEVKSLEKYGEIASLDVKRNRSSALPDLMLVADYGFQGEKYVFNKDQDYLQASVVFTWDLFSGFQNRAKIGQALLQKQIIDTKIEETKNQISLQVINAQNELKASEAGMVAARSQASTAREVFRLVQRKYEEGKANLIEFMDARTTLTQAEENLIVSRFAMLTAIAEFEKVTANIQP